MKLITKFLGSSLVVGGSIFILSLGAAWVCHQADERAEELRVRSQTALDLALDLEVSLYDEVNALKDYVFLDRERASFVRYEQAKSQVLIDLDALELLLDGSQDATLLRRRHRDIVRLASELTEEEASITAMQQDMRALNSFLRDINIYMADLLDITRQQVDLAAEEVHALHDLEETIDHMVLVAILVLLSAQFVWIVRPVLRSIEQLERGVTEVGNGQLDCRLTIDTGDEIEDLGQNFNRMTEQLQTTGDRLNQQIEEIQFAQQAAEAASRAKGTFLASMNHELRTPLNGILGYAQLLEVDETLDPQQRRGAEVIQQCAEHLLAMINDVLDMSKIEAGKVELHPQDMQLPNFLIGVTEIFRIKTHHKGIDFVYEASPDLPIAVRVDDKRLRQVLLNLLSNAVKFTDAGSVTLRVEPVNEPIATTDPVHPESAARSKLGPVRLRFSVEDTGIGMPCDRIAKIFTPFEQVSCNARNSQGTGLGLAISQRIVQMMGGNIQVSSELGRGSRFWFELSLQPAREWHSDASGDRVTRKPTGYRGEPRTILVIDDRPANCELLVNMLEPLGFEMLVADNGRAGLTATQYHQPDLIITDVVMPEMDGLTMTHVSEHEASEAGGTAYLSKPVDLFALLEMVQALLELDWVYADDADAMPAQPENSTRSAWMAPPAEELQQLYELAQSGFIGDVREEAECIKQLDDRYFAFANRLIELAQAFDDEAISELIEAHV